MATLNKNINLSAQPQNKVIFHMGVAALDLGREELATSSSPSPFLGEGAWYVYNPGLGKAGSSLSLVTPSEQAQPLPLLGSDPVEEEDGYQLSHAAAVWNAITSLHALPNHLALPNLAGKLGIPRMFLVQTGLLFLPVAPGEVGWLPALIPSLGGAKLPARKLWQGRELQLGCPSTLLSGPPCARRAGPGWMLCAVPGSCLKAILMETPFCRERRANYHATASFTWC